MQLLATNLQLGLSGRRLISQSECLRLRVSQSSESIEDSFLKGETANWQYVHSKLSQIGDRISRKSRTRAARMNEGGTILNDSGEDERGGDDPERDRA